MRGGSVRLHLLRDGRNREGNVDRCAGIFLGGEKGTSRGLETQETGSKWPFLGVEFPGLSGLQKVSDLKTSVVCTAAIYGSRMHGTGIFVDGSRTEFPGSWKLSNQEANGPFWGSSFQVFRVSKKFQLDSLRGMWCTVCRRRAGSAGTFSGGARDELWGRWKLGNRAAKGLSRPGGCAGEPFRWNPQRKRRTR